MRCDMCGDDIDFGDPTYFVDGEYLCDDCYIMRHNYDPGEELNDEV